MRAIKFLSAAAALVAWVAGQPAFMYTDPFANAPNVQMPAPPKGGTTVSQNTGDASNYNNPNQPVNQYNSNFPFNAINNPNLATSGSNTIGGGSGSGSGSSGGVLNGNQVIFNNVGSTNAGTVSSQPAYPPSYGGGSMPYNPSNPYYPPPNNYNPPKDPQYPPYRPEDPDYHSPPRYPDYTSDPKSPYFEGDCSYNMCLNGGSCMDGAAYSTYMKGRGGGSYGSSGTSGDSGLSGNDAAERALSQAYSGNDVQSASTTAAVGAAPYDPYADPYQAYPQPYPQYPNQPYPQNPYPNPYKPKRWAACMCSGNWYGKYCETRVCDPLQLCSTDPLVLSIPRNVQVECGSDMSATAAGTGAAFATDSCRGTEVTVHDSYERGPQMCTESTRLRRTFVGRDRCSATTQGNQMITVVDTTPPKVTAKLVPMPPLAVSASPITLTPEQTKRLLKVLFELSIFAKKGVFDLSLFKFGDPKNDVSGILGGLIGMDFSKKSMSDVFGDDTAKLLADNGFDLNSISAILRGDPTLSGAGAAVSSSSGSASASASASAGSSGVGLAGLNLGSLINSANPMDSLRDMISRNDAVRAVLVPDNNPNKDILTSFLHSDIALPVGVQTCSLPTTRVFTVKCTAWDACTKSNQLRAAARLKVTHITNRNAIDVNRALDAVDPMNLLMKDPLKDMKKFDPKVMMRPGDDHHFRLMNDMHSKPVSSIMPIKPFAVDGSTSSSSSAASAASSASGSASAAAAASASASSSMRSMDYDALVADASNQGYSTVTGSMAGGGNTQQYQRPAYDPNYNANYDPNYRDPKKDYDPKKEHDPKHDPKKEEKDPEKLVLAVQCKTKVDYVNLYCNDVVSITLDAEDACLADNFKDDKHEWQMDHVFKVDDFHGDVKKKMKDEGFSDQQWLSQTSFKAKWVRGTAVELEVLAEDNCKTVGRAVYEPARDCEEFVSGRCCPPITNGVSQYARDRVLADAFANDPMRLHTGPPVQLGLDDITRLLGQFKKP